MRAELRGFHSMDVPDVNLESYRPDDPESFALSVSASVGPSGERGDEMFDFVVCTARWLAEHPPEKGFSFLRDYILLTRWDYAILERALRDICTHAEVKRGKTLPSSSHATGIGNSRATSPVSYADSPILP